MAELMAVDMQTQAPAPASTGLVVWVLVADWGPVALCSPSQSPVATGTFLSVLQMKHPSSVSHFPQSGSSQPVGHNPFVGAGRQMTLPQGLLRTILHIR